MRKVVLSVIFTMFVSLYIQSQTCIQYGIEFKHQSQIDSFQIVYPGCEKIIGDVKISGNNINNLNGLSVITTLFGDLTIESCNNLVNLSGLDSLMYIIGDVLIKKNNGLENLAGLDNLVYIGGNLSFEYNTKLTTISNLNNLTYLGGNLNFEFNYVLTDLNGLYNLQYVGGFINIFFNQVLTSLSGIDYILPGTITALSVYNNSSLSMCAVQSICDYLASPNGTIEIYNNAAGCNSEAEVAAACNTVSLVSIDSDEEVSIVPNPAINEIAIIHNNGLEVKAVNIFNQLGQRVLYKTNPAGVIDISFLDKGIYFVEVLLSERVFRDKLLVR